MGRKLGELLIEEGRLTAHQLQEALQAQRASGGSLGSVLLRLGLLDEEGLAAAMARMHGVAPASREEVISAPPEIVALLPPEFARRHRAIPFRVSEDEMHLALQNPADTLAVHEAAFLTGFRVIPHAVPESVIKDALAVHFRLETGAFPRLSGPPSPASDTSVWTGAFTPYTPGNPETPPAPLRPLPELGRLFAEALDRDRVLDLALEELGGLFPRALVFAIRGNEAVLWKCRGASRELPAGFSLDLAAPSVFSSALEKGTPAFGPPGSTPVNLDFFTLLGGRAPHTALVVPVAVKGRFVVLLYGDDGGTGPSRPDAERVRRLAVLLPLALESVLLRHKILRESGN